MRMCSQVRFMLETMLALKNNDMRKIPGYNPEPVERLRKLQRSLVGGVFHRNIIFPNFLKLVKAEMMKAQVSMFEICMVAGSTGKLNIKWNLIV